MYIAIDKNNQLCSIDNAVPGWDYYCPVCERKLLARRGEIRQHCFSHMPGEACSDSWDKDYDMSEWHREWQAGFPICNQEVVVQLGDIRHRADVLTGKTVIEFQHSPLSTESFNKRNTFYHDLGYKVVWLFDLTEEYSNSKISFEEKENKTVFSWSHPRNTFRNYDLSNSNIDLFFQITNSDDICIIRVLPSSNIGFSSFSGSKWLSKQDFLEYFQINNGSYPPPHRKDIKFNTEYLSFKNQYNILLDPQQERAVEAIDGSVLLLAVPGSGKTTTLVARIGYMVNCKGVEPEKILALTYTTNSADDMIRRYAAKFGDNKGVSFRTINSLAFEIVNRFSGRKIIAENKDVHSILRSIYKELLPYEYPTEGDIKNAATTLSYIKNMILTPEEGNKILIWDSPAYEILTKYQAKLSEKYMIDFDDQLVLAYQILRENVNALNTIQDQFQYICVDEAQDTSKLQYEMIKLIAKNSKNVFIVGDEDQSIYRFRAAYPKGLLNFKNEFPNPFILQLETNYRSTEEIIELASPFIAKNDDRYPKKMNGLGRHGKKPECIMVPDRASQYDDIIEKARKITAKTAFLYRDNICGLPIADRFIKEGINFQIKKTEDISFFHDHVVNDVRAFLKLSLDPRDTDSFKQIYSKCGLYIKRKELNGICGKVFYEKKTVFQAVKDWFSYGYRKEGYKGDDLRDMIEPLSKMSPADAISSLRDGEYGKYLSEKHTGYGQLEILIALSKDDKTIQDLFTHLDNLEKQLRNKKTENSSDSNIILSTVHSSKGLEYDTVYIIDVFDGMFPMVAPDDVSPNEQYETTQEERRLFYVAMTRAKNNLYFYRISNEASQYMDELFPVKGYKLDFIITTNRSKEVLVKNNLTSKTYYILTTASGSILKMTEIDLDTGELFDSMKPNDICKLMSSPIWERIKQ